MLLNEAILAVLSDHVGKFNAIDRARLWDAVMREAGYEVDDRSIREAIRELRKTHPLGCKIVSDPSWQGYWISESFEEVKDFARRKRQTAANMFADARAQINLARGAFSEEQMRMSI